MGDQEDQTKPADQTSAVDGPILGPSPATQPATDSFERARVLPDPQEKLLEAPKKSGLNKKLLIAVLVFVALYLVGAGAFVAYSRTNKANDKTANNTTKHAGSSSAKDSIQTTDFAKYYTPKPTVSLSGTYFDTAKRLGDLGLFKLAKPLGIQECNSKTGNCVDGELSQIQYYQIGVTEKNQPIIALGYNLRMESAMTYLAIKDAADHYQILARYAPTMIIDDTTFAYAKTNQEKQGVLDTVRDTIASFRSNLASNVGLSDAIELSDLAFPESTSINGLGLMADDTGAQGYPILGGLNSIRGFYFNTPPASLIKLGVANGKDIYEAVVQDMATYQVKELYATVKGVYAKPYYVSGSARLTDSQGKIKPFAITWADGKTSSDVYTNSAPGCGSAYGYMTAKNISSSQLTVVGTTADGQSVYQLPNGSALLKGFYDDYVPIKADSYTPAALRNMTLSQYQTAHALVTIKNALGEYVIYHREGTLPFGGCGKPVVYLYPTKTTNVSVRVGADVTVSDPLYNPFTGWQNVVARPNGQLTYLGKSYDSLYWEGRGFGAYPKITAGTVVPRNQVVPTIKQQLKMQGLNDKEISDFLAFWRQKLPTTPYTRLTWLTTEQMNQLAPLAINPRPNTVIRTFLDFSGLDVPRSMPPQHFSTPERKGFTVVEWGGLLRD